MTSPSAEPQVAHQILANAAGRGDRRSSIVQTPEGPRLVRVSPTQVSTWRLCAQKWKLDKIDKLPRKPPSKGQQIGTEGHSQIEHWAQTGEDVRSDLARLSEPYLRPFLPAIGLMRKVIVEEAVAIQQLGYTEVTHGTPAALVECSLPMLLSPDGVEFNGFVDMMIPPGGHELILTSVDETNLQAHWQRTGDTLLDCRAYPVIIDHKFRADVEKYAPRADDLEDDEQAIIYARAALEWWNTPFVVFRHHNHQTRGRRFANAVTCVMSRDHIMAKFAEICALVDGPMQECVRTHGALAPPTLTSCSAYGGCDFESTCPHSPSNRALAAMRPANALRETNTKVEPNMSLSALLNSALGTPTQAPDPVAQPVAQPVIHTPAPVAAAPVAAAPAAVAQPAPVGLPGTIGVDQAVTGQPYILVGENIALTFAGKLPQGAFFQDGNGQPVMRPLSVQLMPFPVAAAPAAVAQSTPAPVAQPEPVKEPRRMLIVDVPAVSPPDAPAPSPLAAAVAAAPAATTTAAPAAQPATAAPAAAAATTEKPARKPRADKGTKRNGEKTTEAPSGEGKLILCVNCCPTNGAEDLSGFVSDLVEKIASAANLADPRLAPNDHAYGFGRWKAILAAAAIAEKPSGVCMITNGDFNDPVIEALSGVADMVIRSVR